MYRLVFVVALGLGLAAFAGPSRAWAFAGERVDAHVPFAFHVDGAWLPAGQYVIQQADLLEPHLLKITSRDGTEEAYFLTDSALPPHPVRSARLVFDQHGRQRFLHAIWLPDGTGAVVETSPTEVHAAEAVARARARTAPPAGKGR
jgi:hypothetical protein